MNSCVRCQNQDIADITKQLTFLLKFIRDDTENGLPSLDSYDKYYSQTLSLKYKRDYFKDTKYVMPKESEDMRVLLQIIDACYIASFGDVDDINFMLKYSVGQLIPLLELYETQSPASGQKNRFKHYRERFMQTLTEVKRCNSYDIVKRFIDSSVEILMDDPKVPQHL